MSSAVTPRRYALIPLPDEPTPNSVLGRTSALADEDIRLDFRTVRSLGVRASPHREAIERGVQLLADAMAEWQPEIGPNPHIVVLCPKRHDGFWAGEILRAIPSAIVETAEFGVFRPYSQKPRPSRSDALIFGEPLPQEGAWARSGAHLLAPRLTVEAVEHWFSLKHDAIVEVAEPAPALSP